MQMSNAEIVGKFNRADNKKNMLKILAELNGCSQDDIREILRKNDIPEADIPKKAGRPTTKKQKEVTEVSNTGMHEVRKEVPETVKALVNERLESIEKAIKEMINERDELKEYFREVN